MSFCVNCAFMKRTENAGLDEEQELYDLEYTTCRHPVLGLARINQVTGKPVMRGCSTIRQHYKESCPGFVARNSQYDVDIITMLPKVPEDFPVPDADEYGDFNSVPSRKLVFDSKLIRVLKAVGKLGGYEVNIWK